MFLPDSPVASAADPHSAAAEGQATAAMSGLQLQTRTSEPAPASAHAPSPIPSRELRAEAEEVGPPAQRTRAVSAPTHTLQEVAAKAAESGVLERGRHIEPEGVAEEGAGEGEGVGEEKAEEGEGEGEKEKEEAVESEEEDTIADMTGTAQSSTNIQAAVPSGGNRGRTRRRFSLDGAMRVVGAPWKQQRGKEQPDGQVGSNSGSGEIRTLKGWFNTATTSAKSPDEIVAEITRVLEANSVEYERNGYSVAAWQASPEGKKVLRMEFEVCHIPRLALYGLHLKRVMGDVWLYKKFCTELVSQMKL